MDERELDANGRHCEPMTKPQKKNGVKDTCLQLKENLSNIEDYEDIICNNTLNNKVCLFQVNKGELKQ